ncbi:hypothetical protein BT63DRAFT_415609 [Microthyrium microscopicum]|uniref:Uncharacterized protein n=1 Tax=Microthyrium microscopicum TaxID=703497 RepID=A0A6A6UAF1_9PEZI|nr:hypothetical protein BT63DRAFT_415609 [Microthyrium microscopicum]
MLGKLESQKAMKIETGLPPTVSRKGHTVKRLRLTYGPYPIKGANSKEKIGNGRSMDPAGTAFNYESADIPRDATIITSNSTWILKDGKLADINSGLYNHHLLVLDTSKSAPTIAKCANGRGVQPPGMSMFSGSSEDQGGAFYSTPSGEFNSGYYIGKNDRIIMLGDVVNYKNETQEVYHLSDIQYIEGKASDCMEAVTQLWDVKTCTGGMKANPPPKDVKQYSVSGSEMTIVQDGVFLAFRGHLHDGGVALSAKINGKEICSSFAKYGGAASDPNNPGEGTINEMTYCYPKEPMKVKKGDNMTLEASYDLEKHPLRKQHNGNMAETMALMSIFFAGPEMK